MQHLIDRATEGFRAAFGGYPEIIAVAPGRVNLIGEHVDYHDGLVFPAAIDRYVVVAASQTPRQSRFVSEELGEAEPFFAHAMVSRNLTPWSRYGAGMAWAMGVTTDIEACVVSDLPRGAGLSSSAAMEMAFGCIYRHIEDLNISEVELARLGQKCENQFVGVPCGLMDQLASKLGKAGHALLIDIREPENLEAIPIPAGLSIVVCDTGVKHELGDSGYPARRRQSEEAAALLGLKVLRDAAPSQVDRLGGVKFRARHVVSEIGRVKAFAQALISKDAQQVGTLMRESHVSLRDDYEVSCPELDAMAEAAWETGCIGARMTGGGFGGACVALVEDELIDEFVQNTSKGFTARTGLTGNFYVCHAVDGAHLVRS